MMRTSRPSLLLLLLFAFGSSATIHEIVFRPDTPEMLVKQQLPPASSRHASMTSGDSERLIRMKRPLDHISKMRVRRLRRPPSFSSSAMSRLRQKLRRSFGRRFHAHPDYKRLVRTCSADGFAFPRFFDTSHYLHAAPHACHAAPFLLIAVHTRPASRQRRRLLRDTFASLRHVDGRRVVVVFFVGVGGTSVKDEAEEFQDIVQRNFVDHYHNMTYKHIAVLDWTMEYCPEAKFLMKIDDDVFVNVFNAVSYLVTFGLQDFYCSVVKAAKVDRRKNMKWSVKMDEYRGKKYPNYCMGYGYIVSADRVKDLYWCSVFTKFFWIDDVHISGILAKRLRMKHRGTLPSNDMAYAKPSYASHVMADYMLLGASYNEVIPQTFRRYWRAALTYSYV